MTISRSLRWTAAAVLLIPFTAGPALADIEDVDAESALEQARARAAEERPTPAAKPGSPAGLPEGPVPGPLFVGVDDSTVAAQRVDVVTNGFTIAFVGAEVWGSAYDPVGNQVYFNAGSELLVWPVGGAFSSLGTITDPAGAAQAVTGLAFHNGVLYACKNIANEAVYTVNTTTLVATVTIDYVDAEFDCGGLAADPATGTLYMTDDSAGGVGAGLMRINPDGTGTLITPYPAGQTDIDGLAIGGGRAYLVIDEPGSIYVWDFAGAAYQAPLNNPWASSEVFSAGAWIGAPVGTAEITLAKTVGLDPAACGASDYLAAPYGTAIYYCYTVTNTGTVPLTVHDLVDSDLGQLLTGFAFNLLPAQSAFVIFPDVVDGSVTNTATWTASVVGGASAQAEAAATVVALDTLAQIPTLSAWGLAALALGLAGLALSLLRRRRIA